VQPINFVLDHAKWTGSIAPAGVTTAASMTGPPLVLIVIA
jgi:hypothetical protein